MTLEEIEKSFEVFILNPNNYKLLKEFTDEIGLYEISKDYVPKDKTKSKDKVILLGAFNFYERVLQYCTHVYIFRDQPFELINVLKSRLTEIQFEIRRPFINAILKILNNKLRFPFPNEILIQEIERIDVNQEYEFFEIDGQAFKAPVKDNDSFLELKVEALFSIYHGKKSKEKIVDEFIEQNIDKELFEILSTKLPKYHSLIDNSMPVNESDLVKNLDPTTHQRFLVFHYLFKYFDRDISNTDRTVLARFIQFVTKLETGAKKISNTSYYKLINNPFQGYEEDSKTLKTNLQIVRQQFEDIGMHEIAELVSKDIKI